MPTLRTSIVALLALALVALLLGQGERLEQGLPTIEAKVEALGIWGPIFFVVAMAMLTPLLFPDSVFGFVAGVAFGLGAGSVYYLGTAYVVDLVLVALGRSWLRAPILRFAAERPRARAILRGARSDALRLTFLIRVAPVSGAFVSYLLGAARFPWRAVTLGTLGMFPHMFLTVYVGHAAHHVSAVTTRKDGSWLLEDSMLIVGLAAVGALVLVLTRIADRALTELEPGVGE